MKIKKCFDPAPDLFSQFKGFGFVQQFEKQYQEHYFYISSLVALVWIWFRRIRMFLGLMDPDPYIMKQKE